MVQIAFILVGARALRDRWWVLLVIALAFIGVACLILIDAMDGTMSVATQVFGGVFVLEGLLSVLGIFALRGIQSRSLALARALALVFVGTFILDYQARDGMALSLLFGAAFLIDGAARIATALVVRFRLWRATVAVGIVEIVLAAIIASRWPFSHEIKVPLCISLLLLMSGWILMRASLMLRAHLSEVAILALPLYGGRNWYDNAPVIVDESSPLPPSHGPMKVRVWTPAGSADVPAHRPLIDRYIAAVDRTGAISTGHAALELEPDLYISHYPADEIDHPPEEFARILRATAENDVKGRFQPSYIHEVTNWCEADALVEFTRFDARRLRAFWAGYRQDDTYNLTNRNCSVVVAAALDSALEGVLASRMPWLRVATLLANPDVWAAAYIRSRAEAMSWTPGLVLDYANTLKRIIEPAPPPFAARLRDFLKRFRRPHPAPTGAAAAARASMSDS
ncbi:protease [Xanthobacter autotrophicus]|uniref:HdeD family acid-resistance protein n=1 Tax=Xanthobacter TaxID=279 RepID=UPI0024AACB2E|nr:protease [Xanthobacter autotrophicus]MDI4665808.1 protease [Xanthobacter autotrophicus]